MHPPYMDGVSRYRRLGKLGAMSIPDREDRDSDGVFSPPHSTVGNRVRNAESCPVSSKALRRRSSSFVAVQSALFQLNCLEDFDLEMIGEGFFAKVYKVILVYCKVQVR